MSRTAPTPHYAAEVTVTATVNHAMNHRVTMHVHTTDEQLLTIEMARHRAEQLAKDLADASILPPTRKETA